MPSEHPVLKQFGDLVPADFVECPVWASCHSFDDGEPWYDDTDEETFRPWTGDIPVDPAEGMFLVRATFETASGREFEGFATPAESAADASLGILQPFLAASGRFIGFWGGLRGVPADERAERYALLGAGPEIFPIHFQCSAAHAAGVRSGKIEGFYRSMGRGAHVVET